MVATEQEVPGRATLAQRWLARLGLVLNTPVRCTIQPLALRVRVPRDRPGVPNPKPQLDWNRLRQLALTGPGRDGAAADHG